MPAVYNPSTNKIMTYIRDDYGSYSPPPGYEIRDEGDLPEGVELEATPSPPRTWTASQFLARFTDAEQDAIDASDSSIARKAIRTLYTNTEVRSDSKNLISLLAGLVQAGLLTQDRMNDIINPDWSP